MEINVDVVLLLWCFISLIEINTSFYGFYHVYREADCDASLYHLCSSSFGKKSLFGVKYFRKGFRFNQKPYFHKVKFEIFLFSKKNE